MTHIPNEYGDKELVWIYDFEYTETRDLPLYVECARRFGSPVLELGSGTGRVSIPLAEAGFEVWGVEAAPLMIERCRAKMESNPNAPLDIKIVEGDMTNFDLGRTFPLIIIPVNTFLVLDREGQRSCLECCRRCIAPDGALVIDVFHPFGPSRAYHHSGEIDGVEKPVCTRPHPQTGNPVRRFVSQKMDFFNQIAHITNTYIEDAPEGTKKWNFTENISFVYRFEMELMLEAAGMETYNIFGWYDGMPFEPDSELMIFIARPIGA